MELADKFIAIVAGIPNMGKSNFIKYIMLQNHENYSKNPFRYGIVFTKTKFEGAYNFVPAKFVHSKYDPDVLQNLMKIQEDSLAKHRAFVIFDDCLDAKCFSSQLFSDLITTYRHWNISVIIATQYIYRVPPTIRECCRYAVMFRMTTKRSIQALFESFGTFFNNYEEFRKYLLEKTQNYYFILMDRNSKSDKVADVYKCLKVPSPEQIPEFAYSF